MLRSRADAGLSAEQTSLDKPTDEVARRARLGRGRVRSRQFLAGRDRKWVRWSGGSFLGRYWTMRSGMRAVGAALQAAVRALCRSGAPRSGASASNRRRLGEQRQTSFPECDPPRSQSSSSNLPAVEEILRQNTIPKLDFSHSLGRVRTFGLLAATSIPWGQAEIVAGPSLPGVLEARLTPEFWRRS